MPSTAIRDISSEISKLTLRVLEEYDETERAYVALCIDTGAIATGETSEEAHQLIRLVLQSDLRLALEAGSFTNFYRLRADASAIDRWHEATSHQEPTTEPLEVTSPSIPKRGVQSAKISTAKSTRSASVA